MKHYILVNGQPVPEDDWFKWAIWFEANKDQKRVALTDLGEVSVSTVFLGLDHNWRLDGPPVLWETMIFGGILDQYQERYTSLESALAGHKKAVCMAKAQPWKSFGRDIWKGILSILAALGLFVLFFMLEHHASCLLGNPPTFGACPAGEVSP